MINKIPVLAYRVDEAIHALNKLNKKAERYGCEKVCYEIGELYPESRVSPSGRRYKIQMRDITLSNLEAPKVGNFEFLAELEITPDGTLVNAINDKEIPLRFRNAENHCEHCRTKRARKHLYVVRSNKGEFLQIGKTCLRDFLGTDTPAKVAARFLFMKNVKEEFNKNSDLMIPRFLVASEVLALTSRAIKMKGWVSATAAKETNTLSTSGRVNSVLLPVRTLDDDTLLLKNAVCEIDFTEAKNALEWLYSDQAGGSQYIHNLRIVLKSDTIEPRHLNLVCSLINAHHRHLGLAEQRKSEQESKARSQHVGGFKERLRGLKVTCTFSREVESYYGTVLLYKLIDDKGNVFSWFNSGSSRLEVGDSYLIDGTVKSHSEFKGVKETSINRVIVKEEMKVPA